MAQPLTKTKTGHTWGGFTVSVRKDIGTVTEGETGHQTPIHAALHLMADYLTDQATETLPNAQFEFPDPYSKAMVEVSVTNVPR